MTKYLARVSKATGKKEYLLGVYDLKNSTDAELWQLAYELEQKRKALLTSLKAEGVQDD